MLDPRHQRRPSTPAASGRRARRGSPRRRSRGSSSRCPRRPPARHARAGASASVIQTPRRSSGGSGRSASGSMSSRSAAVRDPSEPSAKHFCQPTVARPSGSRRGAAPLRWPRCDRRRDARRRACTHGRAPAADRVGQPGVGREGVREVGVRGDAARVVAGDDPERRRVPARRRINAASISSADRRRDVDRDEPASPPRRSTPSGRPSAVAPDHAAVRVVGRQTGRRDRGVARPQRVVVVRPDRRPATGRHRLEVVGGRPAAPSVAVPAVTLEPRTVRAAARAPPRRLRQAVVERRRVLEIDLPRGHRRLREVQVRVGQAGDRDLVRLQADPLGERVGAGLEIDLRAGERDPSVADADRLDPAEPRIAVEGRDPAGDQHVERHGRSG